MIRWLTELERWQWQEPDAIRKRQDEMLRTLIRTVHAEVPFYRELMDRAGVAPGDVAGREDLNRLPIVTKDMLRAAFPERCVRPTGQPTYVASTSGSTGKNFRVLEDRETAGLYRAAFLLALEWADWRFGEPHVQMGMTVERSVDRRMKDALLGCHYFSAYDLSDTALDRVLDRIDRGRIGHVWGYPGSIHCLARRAVQAGWNRPLRSVVTWGDMLLPAQRRLIELAFRTRVSDTYGCGEGIQVAAQCGESDGYHVHDLNTIVEYVDGDGAPVAEGDRGEIVLTRLHPGPMPLIRYRVGDLGIGGSGTCRCGRGFSRLQSVEGRAASTIKTPGGNRLIVHFFTGILEHFPEVDQFQVVQENLASITVRVVPTPAFSLQVAERVKAALQEKGLRDMDIHVDVVDELPLTPGGKRQFVISAC